MIIQAPALIVIDLLQDYFDPNIWPNSRIPAARERLTARTNELASMFRDHGRPVIWFRQEFQKDLSDAFLHMKRTGRRYTIAGTPGCELLPELEVLPTDTMLLKTRYSAFHKTVLESVLKEKAIRTVVLAGITTAWCIRSTATDAYQRDYDIIFAEDCIDGFTAEDHESSVRAMDGLLGPFLSNARLAKMIE